MSASERKPGPSRGGAAGEARPERLKPFAAGEARPEGDAGPPVLKLTFAYDGTAFRGWQRLPGKARTVQGTIEECLSALTGREVEIAGSSRTDSGVHAEGQVASASLEWKDGNQALLKKLNARLPEDVVCLAIEDAPPRFHARLRATGKAYRYRILDKPLRDPFSVRYCHQVDESLDLEAMARAAEFLKGERDFTSFTNLKEKGKSFVRTIYSIAVKRNGPFVDIRFTGDGFLHNQVRIMAGALIDAGLGKLSPEAVGAMLAARSRAQASEMAPARGLCLCAVFFEGSTS